MAATSLTDGQLVARCRRGDQDAWRLLVERFSRYVHAISIQGFRLSEHDAEDVFQEVFARAYQRLGQLRDDDAVRPWLAQLTRRACLDRLRVGARVDPVAEIDAGEVDETLEMLEDAWFVRELLEHLTENCREILDRFFAQDQAYATIGEELGLPPGTIASRISRCLAKLRSLAEGRSGGRRRVKWTERMSGYDEERLGRLLAALPPAPEAWVRAAQDLPFLRAQVDEIIARAEADAAFRERLIADLNAALETEGYEPERRLVDEVRSRLEQG